MGQARCPDAGRRRTADGRHPGIADHGREAALPGLSELPGASRIQLRERLRAQCRPSRRSRRAVMAPGSLVELEAALRERLAGTLPGLEAQLRFAPTPPRAGWKPGEFPSDARPAAALLLL